MCLTYGDSVYHKLLIFDVATHMHLLLNTNNLIGRTRYMSVISLAIQ